MLLSTRMDSALTDVRRARIVADGCKKSPGCGVDDGSNGLAGPRGGKPPEVGEISTGSTLKVGGGGGA